MERLTIEEVLEDINLTIDVLHGGKRLSLKKFNDFLDTKLGPNYNETQLQELLLDIKVIIQCMNIL